MAIETTFETNPRNGLVETAIETTLPPNPSNVQLMEVLTNLQEHVGVLNSQVTTLEKKVHQLEESNFKLGKKINKISSRKMSSKGASSKIKIEPKKPKPEQKKIATRVTSFGGGGKNGGLGLKSISFELFKNLILRLRLFLFLCDENHILRRYVF